LFTSRSGAEAAAGLHARGLEATAMRLDVTSAAHIDAVHERLVPYCAAGFRALCSNAKVRKKARRATGTRR
jgi:hypothetical protein